MPNENPYPQIKEYERREFERLNAYLKGLDAAGWVEQSYCTDWQVYQVVSHIGSGSKIGGLRIAAWVSGGPAVTRETMQQIWGHFDSLQPEQMYASYAEAVQQYLQTEATTPDEAGMQEVDGFAGKRPLYAYQLSRVWELSCHAWDVYVARNRGETLHPDAVKLLAAYLHFINLPVDKERASTLSTISPAAFHLTDSNAWYTLDLSAERPRAARAESAGDAPLAIEGPDEEIVRFVSGRHFVPGSQPKLKVSKGSAQDLANLRRAFR